MRKKKSDPTKTAYSRVNVWARKKKKPFSLTWNEFKKFRKEPCTVCDKIPFGTGIGFVLIDKKGDVTPTNMLPMCGVCRLIKPVEEFNLQKHCTQLLRRNWRRAPMASICLQRAKLQSGKYLCNVCKIEQLKKNIQIDHIEPVIRIDRGFESLDVFASRLYCSESNLQVICKICHSKKTKDENAERRKHGKTKNRD